MRKEVAMLIFQFWAVVYLYGMCKEVAMLIFQCWEVVDLYGMCKEVAILIFQCWAVVDLYGMCEEVVINGSEGHSALVAETLELRDSVVREKWNQEDETKNKDEDTKDDLSTSKDDPKASKDDPKACKDVKNSLTSSQLLPPALTKAELLTGSSRRNCEYLATCTRFKNSLGLPASYFEKVTTFLRAHTFHTKRHRRIFSFLFFIYYSSTKENGPT